jgi:O-antigen/teichoic acid export membrane protein
MILGLALAMGAVQVANLLSYRVELLILRRYDTLADVGVYSIAVQTAESLWLIAGAVATAVTAPALHDTEARAVRLVARAAGRALGLTALAGVAAGAAAPFIVPSALGEGFREASPALALLLPGAIAYAPVAVLVVYLSVRRGRPRLSLIVALVGLVVTTSSALALIPPFGVRGAAAASTIGYLVAAALAWGLFVRLARQG